VFLLVLEGFDVYPVLEAEAVGLHDPVLHLRVFVQVLAQVGLLLLPGRVLLAQLLLQETLHVPQLPLAHDFFAQLLLLSLEHTLLLLVPGLALLQQLFGLGTDVFLLNLFQVVFVAEICAHVLLHHHNLGQVAGVALQNIFPDLGFHVLYFQTHPFVLYELYDRLLDYN